MLVHVEFDWSDEFGPCLDCGLPAAYEITHTPTWTARYCSVCTAEHAYLGDTNIAYLFAADDE